MKLRVTYVRARTPVDLELDVEGVASIGDVAKALVRTDPLRPFDRDAPATVALLGTPTPSVLQTDDLVGTSLLGSGAQISLVAPTAPVRPAGTAAAILRVVEGPDAPAEFALHTGSNYVGRGADMDVRLTDALVSKSHAKVNVGSTIEIVDNGSANGVELDGVTVDRAVLRPSDRVTMGDTVIEVVASSVRGAPIDPVMTGTRQFVRPPRVVPRFEPEKHPAPEAPGRQTSQRFPMVALVTPVILGGVLYAVTKSLTSLLFVALSPLMMVGQWAESRWSGRRAHAEAVEEFHSSLSAMVDLVRERQGLEREVRLSEHPSTAQLTQSVSRRGDLLWCRRPDAAKFLVLRLGLGTDESRVSVDASMSRSGQRELQEEVISAADAVRHVEAVPIVADLGLHGNIGVAGRGEAAAAAARSIAAQAAALHSPAELVIAACVGGGTTDRWEWLVWLPHTQGTHSPVPCDLLASGAVGSTSLITAIEELVAGRRLTEEARDVPHMLLIVEDDAVVERSRLVALAESGPSVGVHLLWSSPSRERLPAACRSFVVVDDNGTATAGFPDEGRTVDLAVESLTLPAAAAMARDMAPLVDAGAPIDNASDLPRSVSYLALSGTALVDDATNVVDRWVETDSLASRRAPGRRRTPGSLRALVGQAATGPLYLDLRTQGPHALVGGTTGSGKSELLQSWVLGMAAAHSPERVTFLFVDYKGGSAFGECVRLPHSVGLVTDLSPHLVRRALVSLSAELRYREHILGAAKAKDLAEMEQSGDPLAPPSLVIVVDEFAALAHDVPEFVDGVVNIAQRGRSLGLHLILATQRPAGVIKDNLRANTNLRLALRMADAEDSTDILGTDVAASFDPAIPGRAAVRSGPGSLLAFQSAYVGGWTSEAVSGPEIVVRELSLRGTVPWDDVAPPAPASDGPNDLERLVEAITSAAEITAVAPPRRPWLPELPAVVELSALPTGRRDEQLVFALADSPMDQAQPPASFDPDRDGNLAVVGTGGSGKTTVLRSLAAAAGFTVRGGPVHVYGLDFGARGLAMLETLPHVGSVIAGDDVERVQRLFRWLRQTIDERSQRYAAVQASSITEYRIIAGRSDETRLLLMLDGFAAFRQAYDTTSNSGLMEALTALAADGRPVGVHVIIAADRMAAIPSSLASLVPRRLVLRAADENELSLLGVPRDLFGSDAPAGRGWLDGAEIQVGVLGGSTSLAAQAKAMDRLADAIRRNTTWPAAGDIGRLPDSVELSGLPADVGGSPVLGLEDESLAPIGLSMSGTFIVAGPPASGRSTTVTTIVRSAVRCRPGTRTVLLAPARSALLDVVPWHRSAVGLDPAAELVDQLLGEVTHDGEPWLLVVESPAEFLNTAADLPLQDLVKELRQEGHLVVGEGDTQSMAGSWPLLQAIRFSRRGIVLQPDQTDGDLLLRTSFPRVRRADFPAGRGLLVREGRVMKVQVARS